MISFIKRKKLSKPGLLWNENRCNRNQTFQKVQLYFPQKSWGSSGCFLAQKRQSLIFLLLSSGFCLWTVQCRPFKPGLFHMMEPWTLTLVMWALQFCRWCSGIFCDLLNELLLCSWSDFNGPAKRHDVRLLRIFWSAPLCQPGPNLVISWWTAVAVIRPGCGNIVYFQKLKMNSLFHTAPCRFRRGQTLFYTTVSAVFATSTLSTWIKLFIKE